MLHCRCGIITQDGCEDVLTDMVSSTTQVRIKIKIQELGGLYGSTIKDVIKTAQELILVIREVFGQLYDPFLSHAAWSLKNEQWQMSNESPGRCESGESK